MKDLRRRKDHRLVPRKGGKTRVGDRTKPSGFTLLELILVLSLVLLLLGMVTASFAGFLSASRVQATAREMAASLKQAKALAAVKGEPQNWYLDLDQRVFGIEGREEKKIPPPVNVTIQEEGGETITQGRYPLTFEANWGARGVRFRLFDAKRSLGIELDPVLGAVAVKG